MTVMMSSWPSLIFVAIDLSLRKIGSAKGLPRKSTGLSIWKACLALLAAGLRIKPDSEQLRLMLGMYECTFHESQLAV
jgi:hypothetical protein